MLQYKSQNISSSKRKISAIYICDHYPYTCYSDKQVHSLCSQS